MSEKLNNKLPQNKKCGNFFDGAKLTSNRIFFAKH